MIHIEILPEFKKVCKASVLKKATLATLSHYSSGEADLTLVFTGDPQVQILNKTYLNKDSTTDVLSFASTEINPETKQRYLGDVIISVPQAQSQAEAAGHSLIDELSLLVIHGVLHLLGFNHAGVKDKKQMWAGQKEILQQLGISPMVMNE